jgi:hypothetical protein
MGFIQPLIGLALKNQGALLDSRFKRAKISSFDVFARPYKKVEMEAID